jgi:hypothetical protein
MKANYNMTGKERKELVHAIERITGAKAEYKFMPTCAYEIRNITVDKGGTVICDDEDKLNKVMTALAQNGFYPDAEHSTEPQAPSPEAAERSQEPTQGSEEETAGLSISLPLDAANVGTLTNILSSKGDLIRHALGVTDLRINVTDDKIEFPWFSREVAADEVKAYTFFISLLCKFSKELKHASSKPVETDNEKYAFRCFLLRLGFIGPEYKDARKILLQNLTGNSAFRHGAPVKAEPAEVQNQEVSE